MPNSPIILAIHSGHNATAALFKDGQIVGCVSEERFSRVKNQGGFPTQAVGWLLDEFRTTPEKLDGVAIVGVTPTATLFPDTILYSKTETPFSRIKRILGKLEGSIPLVKSLGTIYVNKISLKQQKSIAKKLDRIIADRLNVPIEKITRIEHHLAHAATVYGTLCDTNHDWLIFTADGGGDLLSSTVSIGRHGELTRIAQTPDSSSLGTLYSAVTQFLGMKPMEHEYKVMGLAPYTKPKYVSDVYEMLSDIISLPPHALQFKSSIRTNFIYDHLANKLVGQRFDSIAGAIQKLTEDLLVQWVKNAIKKTGIQRVACAGGVFMNVKANMVISQLPEVEKIHFSPSCGDESIPIGAALLLAGRMVTGSTHEVRHTHVPDLYLGNEYTEKAIEAFIKRQSSKNYTIQRSRDIDKAVAKLLAEGHIVARFAGRMEWGARALGNRSILAHPQNYDTVRIINEQIKSRDFWMPFAGSILDRRAKDYLVNPQQLDAPYMIITFPTTAKAQRELRAAMHPYDFTIRPQIVTHNANPSYYHLLEEFERLTGIGGVLNTSLNLHGEPLVCSFEDAWHTFVDSGLQWLALGNFLVHKNQSSR